MVHSLKLLAYLLHELYTKVYLMYLCEMTEAKYHIHKYMVLQSSKLFYFKVSSEILRQDSQSSYSFGKIQNVGETGLSEEKHFVFHWRKISYFVFIYIFPLVLLHTSSFQIYTNIYIYFLMKELYIIYIYIYIYIYV